MMNNKKLKKNHFLLLEIVMAIGLLIILTAGFFGGLKTLKRMDRSFNNERRALMVIDNTLERLQKKKHYDSAGVERIFNDEYAKAGFAPNSKIKSMIKEEPNQTVLAVLKPNSKPFIEVKIKVKSLQSTVNSKSGQDKPQTGEGLKK